MKFSELWLREWTGLSISTTDLVEQMIMIGMEVDAIKPVSGKFFGVVVGQIVECKRRGNDGSPWITKINIGHKQDLLNVFYHASKCQIGSRVAVAKVGATLFNNVKVQEKRSYGILSEGIVCSFPQLGITEYNEDIIELPSDAPIGGNVRDYLRLEDNTIDIKITPNRVDCLSLIGIARDIQAYNRMPLLHVNIKKVAPVISDNIPISIEKNDVCSRYVGRVVKGINANAITPLWMKEKLRRSGLQSKNIIQDITNFIFLELGQPLRIFDYNCIDGGITVRYAKKNELLHLQDNSNIKLLSDTVVIADYKKVLAIAGVVSGDDSSINLNTRSAFLECASLKPLSISRCAKRYGLHTSLSYRYQRGIDPALKREAIERATALLVEICNGQPGPVIDVSAPSNQEKSINIILHRKKLDKLIGFVIPDQEVSKILFCLGFQVNRIGTNWKVLVPTWRFDIALEEDLIEEVVRIYGYNLIPDIPMQAELVMQSHSELVLSSSRVKTLLADRGYQETITYSFVNPKIQSLLYPQTTALVLPNPISHEMSVMRLSLWTGLLNAVIYNQNRQKNRIRLFEFGLCFIPDKTADLGVQQNLMLAGMISGHRFNEHWDQKSEWVDFYDIKGDLEMILELSGKLDDCECKAQQHTALHPGQSAAIYLKNEIIGFIGSIHPQLKHELGLKKRVFMFELLWDKIAQCKIPQAHSTSRFPMYRRDIAVVVDNDVSTAEIIMECKKALGNQLVKVNLFDIFQGKGVQKGCKSLAISLTLQSASHTLKEQEIASFVLKCIAALKQRFKIIWRN